MIRIYAIATATLLCVACPGCSFENSSGSAPAPSPPPGTTGPNQSGSPSEISTPQKPDRSTPSGPPPGRIGDDLTKAEPQFKLTAEAWTEEFKKDKKAAAAKYKNAVVELSGTVAIVGPDTGSPGSAVSLKGANFQQVLCYMVDAESWARVAAGSVVKIKGKAAGFVEDALYGCVFVEVGANPAVEVKAEDLAKEFVQDKSKTDKKYSSKPMIVEGEVVSAGRDKNGNFQVVLKGDGSTMVNCRFEPLTGRKPPELKSGQRIKLAGESDIDAKHAEVRIRQVNLITGGK